MPASLTSVSPDTTVLLLTAAQPAWLFPAILLPGICLQLYCFAYGSLCRLSDRFRRGLWRRKLAFLLAGTGCVLLAAWLDKDLTLMVGQILVTAGFCCLEKKMQRAQAADRAGPAAPVKEEHATREEP